LILISYNRLVFELYTLYLTVSDTALDNEANNNSNIRKNRKNLRNNKNGGEKIVNQPLSSSSSTTASTTTAPSATSSSAEKEDKYKLYAPFLYATAMRSLIEVNKCVYTLHLIYLL